MRQLRVVEINLLGRTIPLTTYPGAVRLDISGGAMTYRAIGLAEREKLASGWGWACARYADGFSVHLGLNGPDVGASLLHELVHLALVLGGTDPLLKDAECEAVCENIAYAFASFLRDNPELVRFVIDSEQYRREAKS